MGTRAWRKISSDIASYDVTDFFLCKSTKKKDTHKKVRVSKLLLSFIEELKTELLHGLNGGGGLYEICHRKNRYKWQMEVSYELNAIK